MIPAYERIFVKARSLIHKQLGGEDFDIQEYLRGLFNTLLLHDVVARLKINDVMILQDICAIYYGECGKLAFTK